MVEFSAPLATAFDEFENALRPDTHADAEPHTKRSARTLP